MSTKTVDTSQPFWVSVPQDREFPEELNVEIVDGKIDIRKGVPDRPEFRGLRLGKRVQDDPLCVAFYEWNRQEGTIEKRTRRNGAAAASSDNSAETESSEEQQAEDNVSNDESQETEAPEASQEQEDMSDTGGFEDLEDLFNDDEEEDAAHLL